MRPPAQLMAQGMPRGGHGFTLLEVMIVLGIFATILVILFGTYSAAVERAERTRERAQVYHEARALLDLMAQDLRSAYVEPRPSTQATLTPPKVRYPFVGEDVEEDRLPADKLTFYALLPPLRPEAPDAEVCRIAYTIEPKAERSQEKILFRRVNCSLDPEATEREQVFPLTDLARGLDLEFYDAQGGERLEWDSRNAQQGNRLPARVKIVVMLIDQRGFLRPFEMLTEIVLDR